MVEPILLYSGQILSKGDLSSTPEFVATSMHVLHTKLAKPLCVCARGGFRISEGGSRVKDLKVHPTSIESAPKSYTEFCLNTNHA